MLCFETYGRVEVPADFPVGRRRVWQVVSASTTTQGGVDLPYPVLSNESYATDGYHLVVAVAPAQCHRRIGSREVNCDTLPQDLKVRYSHSASYARDGGMREGQVHVGARVNPKVYAFHGPTATNCSTRCDQADATNEATKRASVRLVPQQLAGLG